MIKKNNAIWSYVFVSVIYILAVFFNFEKIAFFSKIAIIPSITWYTIKYINVKKNKLVYLTLFLFYLGDLLLLFFFQKNNSLSIIPFVFAYLTVIHFQLKDLKIINKKSNIKNVDATVIAPILVILIIFITLFINLEIYSSKQFFIYLLLAIELSLLAILAVLLNYFETKIKNFLLAMAVLCFVLSDLFYVFYTNFTDLKILELINVSTQTLSYLFLSNYFIESNLRTSKE